MSGNATFPIFGSIVQNGKFSAGISDLVKALNKVDFPTFGRPIIPHLKPLYNLILYEVSFEPFLFDFHRSYQILLQIF